MALPKTKTPPSNKPPFTRTKVIGLLLGPTLMLAILMTPLSLTWEQQALLAVIFMTVTYWITQPIPIPVTSILGLTLTVVLNVAPARTVFGAFSSPTLFLLIGGFMITLSMVKYGLGQRVALGVLSLPGIGHSTTRIIFAFGLLAALLSGVIDNGAVASMLVPIAIGLVQALAPDIHEKRPDLSDHQPLRFATALMLITAYGATVGALLTPFGDATNMVGREFIQAEFDVLISVGSWMALAVPIVAVLFLLLVTIVILVNRPEVRTLPNAQQHLAEHRRQLGRMSRGEKNTAIAFGLAVFLWLLPALMALTFGHGSAPHLFLVQRLPPPVVAILVACSLFLMPVNRTEGFTLRWRDVRQMDWGPVLLVGCALALGNLMTLTGLAQVFGAGLADRIGNVGPLIVSFLASGTAILFSEISTNLVSITVLVPTIPPVAEAGGGDPLVVALIATFSAIYGFMLPISTSANAIVFGSGQVPVWQMIKTGFFVDLSGILVIVTGVTMLLHIVQLVSL
ncbi:MAG: DASS family sodium-coupled anion symporter [Saccharospirillum sp.]|uniref:SLC13 family permease n=1 Tax=Saccharospirillum sp. TaxID=2033801 RepID=UPI0032999953